MLEPTKQEQHTTVSAKKKEREKLQEQIATYLSNGGVIQDCGTVDISSCKSPARASGSFHNGLVIS